MTFNRIGFIAFAVALTAASSVSADDQVRVTNFRRVQRVQVESFPRYLAFVRNSSPQAVDLDIHVQLGG